MFSDTTQARNAAQAFVEQTFTNAFMAEYDRLVASGAIDQESILEGMGFIKCVAIITAEGYAAPSKSQWDEQLKNLRKF